MTDDTNTPTDWSLYERTALSPGALPLCVMQEALSLVSKFQDMMDSHVERARAENRLPPKPDDERRGSMVMGAFYSAVTQQVVLGHIFNAEDPTSCALDFNFHIGRALQLNLDIEALRGSDRRSSTQKPFATKRDEILERLASRKRDVAAIEAELAKWDEEAAL